MMRTIATLVGLIVGMGSAAHAGEIYLYEKPGPSGESLEINDDTPDLSAVPHAFQIRALKVMRGGWVLCSEPNYQGNCLWVIGRFVRNMTTTPYQDDVRSVKGGGKVHNYPWPKGGSGINAQIVLAAPIEDGRYAPLTEDIPDLAAAGVDFPIRAVGFGPTDNFAYQLCTEPNYHGRCILMFNGIDQLNAIFVENIASVRRVPAISSPAGNSYGPLTRDH
jgi:hypothetical protein